MKTTHILLACALAAVGTLSPALAENETAAPNPSPKSSHTTITSPGGFIAHSLRVASDDGEPEGRVLIEKDGVVIATLKGVRAVSFSPVGDILLVCEAVADDDLRHYLLNIGTGQYTRTKPRLQYVFGSRWVNRAVWSADGRFLVLFDHPGMTDSPPETITVADKLGA